MHFIIFTPFQLSLCAIRHSPGKLQKEGVILRRGLGPFVNIYETVQLKPIYGWIIVWPRVWREKTKLMVTNGHFCHFLRLVKTIGAFPVKVLTDFQQRAILMFQKGGEKSHPRPGQFADPLSPSLGPAHTQTGRKGPVLSASPGEDQPFRRRDYKGLRTCNECVRQERTKAWGWGVQTLGD